ncbi:MAG: hypothetical protein K8S55_04455 [Phycisphaerae bacterium]|nr:hypothetical protein [Phycisphaerae bacterium]
MKKIITIVVFVVLAGASFGVSFMVSQGVIKANRPGKPKEVDPTAATVETKLLNGMAAASSTQMRPKETQLDELIRELRARTQQLDRRKRDLDERERRLAMASDQLQRQSEDLEKLRIDLVAAMTPLKNARKQLLKGHVMIKAQEVRNLQNTAKMYAKMDPANAARILLEMIKNRQADSATKIIRFLPEKSWAAIMDEFKEMGPAMEIIQKQLKVIQENRQG